MKHKEEVYRLFPMTMSGWLCFHLGVCYRQPLEAIPLLLLLARSQAMFLMHSVIAKPELVDAVSMLLPCCITFSTMFSLG